MHAISLDTDTYSGQNFTSEYTLAILDTIGYAERIADAERNFSAETRRMLAEICADCEEILAETLEDLQDFGADFSELEIQHFS